MQRNLLLKERLNGLRKDRDLTLEEVAEATGVAGKVSWAVCGQGERAWAWGNFFTFICV